MSYSLFLFQIVSSLWINVTSFSKKIVCQSCLRKFLEDIYWQILRYINILKFLIDDSLYSSCMQLIVHYGFPSGAINSQAIKFTGKGRIASKFSLQDRN